MKQPDVTIKCKNCNNEFVVQFKQRKRRFCSTKCASSGVNNPAYGRTYRSKATHPEWAQKISETHIVSDRMRGDNNPMKRPDVAAKMSQTRIANFANDGTLRKRVAELMRQNWADGKYDGVKTGKCLWYEHTKPDGVVIKLQGTWEVVYARYLDSQNIDYHVHHGRIPYVDNDGIERSYYPDFYIVDSETYHDVKGAFWSDQQRIKFELIKRSNPNLKIKVIDREVMSELGINVDREAIRLKEQGLLKPIVKSTNSLQKTKT